MSVEKKRKKRQLVLTVLRQHPRPLASAAIAEEIQALGHDMSERSTRLYLQELAGEGLVECDGRKGHRITASGLAELDSANSMDRVGFMSARIDQMTYRMTFDLNTASGTVAVNLTLVPPRDLAANLPFIQRVFAEGYALGDRIALFGPGEKLGHMEIPPGMVGVGTVCSVTLNGVLLKHGIPTASRFSGLLELRHKRPVRFAEIIMYEGTSVVPLELFIRSGMTSYLDAIRDGSGRIGASFRELPADSREQVLLLADRLRRIGLGGFLTVGRPGQAVLDIPVSEGRVGAIVIGGLNPMSILQERGFTAWSRAMSGLVEYGRLFPCTEMTERLQPYL